MHNRFMDYVRNEEKATRAQVARAALSSGIILVMILAIAVVAVVVLVRG